MIVGFVSIYFLQSSISYRKVFGRNPQTSLGVHVVVFVEVRYSVGHIGLLEELARVFGCFNADNKLKPTLIFYSVSST